MDSTGIFSGKPRPTNPYVVWAPDEHRGIRGFILTLGKFLKLDENNKSSVSSYPSGNLFLTDQINPQKPQEPRFPTAWDCLPSSSNAYTSDHATNTRNPKPSRRSRLQLGFIIPPGWGPFSTDSSQCTCPEIFEKAQ